MKQQDSTILNSPSRLTACLLAIGLATAIPVTGMAAEPVTVEFNNGGAYNFSIDKIEEFPVEGSATFQENDSFGRGKGPIGSADIIFACGASDEAIFDADDAEFNVYTTRSFGAGADGGSVLSEGGACSTYPNQFNLNSVTWTAKMEASPNLYEITFHTWRDHNGDCWDIPNADPAAVPSPPTCAGNGDLTSYTRTLVEDDPIPEYTCKGFLAPLNHVSISIRSARVLPFGFNLEDANGEEVTDIDLVKLPVIKVGSETAGGNMRYNRSYDGGKWFEKIKFETSAPSVTVESGDILEYTIAQTCEIEVIKLNRGKPNRGN